jgi:GNAT superfamily N-acetyltransferase
MTLSSEYEIFEGNFHTDFDQGSTDMDRLYQQHWDEVGFPGGDCEELLLDKSLYRQYNDLDAYRCFGIRQVSTGKIVGYLGCFISPLAHNINKLVATTDAIYIEPEHRKGLLAFKLVRYAEKVLASCGVHYLDIGANASYDIDKFCRHLGFVPSTVNYIKKIY